MDVADEGFALREAQEDGRLVLRLSGDLDIAATDELQSRLDALREDGASPVVLDLSELEFIDSSGLACITRAIRDARQEGRELEVGRELRDQVKRLLELVDGEQLFWPTR
jgi:anti-sigma B factor antagonist